MLSIVRIAALLFGCAVTADAFMAFSSWQHGQIYFPAKAMSGIKSTRFSMTTVSGSQVVNQAQIAEATRKIKARHTPAIAKDIDALFTRMSREQAPVQVKLNRPLPSDLPGGALLRIGPNPRPGSDCRGFLDGDGMLLSIVIRPPEERADYCTLSTAWIRTRGYEKEEAAGGKDLFQGTLGAAPRGWPVLGAVLNNFIRGGQIVKDTCNTAVKYHAGKILALMEQCRPSEISVSQDGRIRTLKALSDLEGAVPPDAITGGALSAHSRTDAATGEMICISYATGGPGQGPPTARHDVFSADGRLRSTAIITLPAPVMIHDLAITESRSVIFDLPLTVRVEKAFLDRFVVEYEKDTPARLGLIPRHGSADDVQWFNVAPGVALHAINAYDRDDGCVVVQAFRAIPESPSAYIIKFTPSFAYEWVLDPSSSTCIQERYLSDAAAEFPNLNPGMHGRPARYAYAMGLSSAGGPINAYSAPQESPKFDSIIKFDLETGGIAQQYTLPDKNVLVAETVFVAKRCREEDDRKQSKQSGTDKSDAGREDDGYILTLCSTVDAGAIVGSKMLVLDASDLGAGPVSEVDLPLQVPFGLHSDFVDFECLSPN